MNNPKSQMNKIFWGLVIVFIDFHIAQVDIFPDVIGYMLAASGLGKLKEWSVHFSKAHIAAVGLAVLSVPGMFLLRPFPLNESYPGNMTLFMMISIVVMRLLHLLLMYWLVQGIIELSKGTQLAASAHARFTFYMAGTFLSLIALPFTFNVGYTEGAIIVGGSAVLMMIMELVMLFLIRRFRREFHGSKQKGAS
jgi:hypothetical protein